MTTTPVPPKLLVLDGPALLAHAYRSITPDTARTADGQTTNAVSGFVTLLTDTLVQQRPTHLAVAFDGPGQNLRAQRLRTYRAVRTATYVQQQEPLLNNLLTILGVATLTADAGRESGDLIASLAARADIDTTVIVSSDERTLQCTTDTVTVLRPAPGRAPEHLGPEEILNRYGLPVSMLVDYMTLRGDRPRGLAPIPGVGDKTAKAWLRDAGSLDSLLAEHGKAGAHVDRLTVYRNVLSLDTHHPTPGLSMLTVPDPVSADIIAPAFTELGLAPERALAVFGIPPAAAPPAVRIRSGELPGWLSEHANGSGTHAVAISSSVIAIAAPDRSTVYLDLPTATSEDRDALGQWLMLPHIAKAVHDAKSIRIQLAEQGWRIENCHVDLTLASYLLAPGAGDYSLDTLTTRYLNNNTPAALGQTGTLFDESTEPAAVTDARTIAALTSPLTTELTSAGMSALYQSIERPLTALLADLEDRGVAVDRAQLKTLRDEYAASAAAAKAAAERIVDHPVTLGSTKQLQTVLFQELGLPPTKRIKSGYSTAADELTKLHERTGHPFLTELMNYRAAIKLAQMIDGLLKHIDSDGRIHTTLLQTKVETGRLASETPNLQNIPTRTPNGRRIREAFVPGAGFDLIMSADYSQLEMRIMAHASGDQDLLAAFTSGEDMHRTVAALAFGIPLADVTAEQRSRAKAISYGLAYGQTVHGLASELQIPLAEARNHYAAYFNRFGAVRDFLDSLVERARRTGYTETLFGRRRYLPELASNNPRLMDSAERAALNAPIQGTAADIIKLAMLRIEEQIHARGLRARMLLQIHDELLFELPAAEHEELTDIVQEVMPTVADLSIPLEVSIGVGSNWAQAHS